MDVMTESEALEAFNEHLDSDTGPIEIAGIEYDVCEVFKEIDPKAYRETFENWLEWMEIEILEGID